jgi:hypothetical protein
MLGINHFRGCTSHNLHLFKQHKVYGQRFIEPERASRPLINFGDNVNYNLGGLTF